MGKRRIVGLTLAVLTAVSLIVGSLQRPPEEVASAYCNEHGLTADKLALLGYRSNAMPVASRQTIEFQIKGSNPPKKLVVTLHQAIYFLPWHVVQSREESLR